MLAMSDTLKRGDRLEWYLKVTTAAVLVIPSFLLPC